MRILLVLLVMLVTSPPLQSQSPHDNWKRFEHTHARFEVEIPGDWKDLGSDKFGAMFSHADVELLEEGIPGPYHPWVLVQEPEVRCFDTPPGVVIAFDKFPATKSTPAYRAALVCKQSFEVILGFWEGNRHKDNLEFELKRILESLKRLPAK